MPKPNSRPDPVWLHPDDPDYWDYQLKKVRKLRAAFSEAAKPKKLVFNLTAESMIIVQEALNWAMEHTGTPHKSQAIEHVCTEYIHRGPHAGAMERIEIKHQILTAGLDDLMEQSGPRKAIEAFNRVFPDRAIVDLPK